MFETHIAVPTPAPLPTAEEAPLPGLVPAAAEAPLEHSLHSAGCRNVQPVLNRVGDKWSMLIVMILSQGPRRFNDLKRQIDGISQRMLTLTLRGLERDGLVSRTAEATVPPRVTYALTELGDSLRSPVAALGEWAIARIACIRAAQERFDMRALAA